jgi:membrane-associated phospholipid phosphatase
MNRRRSREDSTEMMSTEDTTANVIHGTAGSHAIVRDPRSVALWLLGAYLGATGLLLTGWLAVMHGVLLVVVVWGIRQRGDGARFVGDLLPLIAAPALYAEIPLLIAAVKTAFHDAAIQSIELALFGGQPAREFALAFPNLALSEVLHAGYLAYYPFIFIPPLLLYVRGNRRGYLETVAALTATYLVCWAIFVMAPVEGPRYEWGPATAPDGPMRRLANAVLAAGSSRGAAFPSSHMAVMVAQAVMAFRWQRRMGVVVSVTAALVGFGAVYGGFHYATDMIAGAFLGALMSWSCLLLFLKVGELRAQ